MLAPQLQRWKRYPMAAQEEIPIEEVQPVESKELAQPPFFFRRRPRIALFIATPISLLLIQQILFAKLNYVALVLYVGIVFGCWTVIFILGHIASTVAREVRRTFKPLTKLQWNMDKHSTLSKWKVTLK